MLRITEAKQSNNGVLAHDSTLVRPGTTLANEMNFVMNHAPGAGSIARPVDQQSSALWMPPNRITYQYTTIHTCSDTISPSRADNL